MGRKDEARRVAVAADVPVVPALEAALESLDQSELVDRAVAEVGLPLLVKAAAGGGGKGMRVVRRAEELPGALAAARREAAAAFGDDTLLIERYVEHGRHVEVQVLADAHGNVVHLFERDCSVQRRHQKVVEEAPAPTIDSTVREAVTSAAVRLARQVGYVNAGTVEFLVAGSDVYLLEMNTRLQVEHPVTELVTGLDLVRLQLDVAQGRSLPFSQRDVGLAGHAIEARVYAEDPSAGFLPQAGVATTVRWTDRARVDAALQPGQRVDTWYDPMLGKVIAHGASREAARHSLVAALDDTAIFGLPTNLGFLRRLVDSAAYRDAAIDTAWLDRTPDPFPPEPAGVALCAAAWALAENAAGLGIPEASRSPFGVSDGWRLAGPPAPLLVELEHRGQRAVLRVDPRGGRVEEVTGSEDGTAGPGRRWEVHRLAAAPESVPAVPAPGGHGRLRLEIDGVLHDLQVEVRAHDVTVGHHGEASRFSRPDTLGAAATTARADDVVLAPMPGTVLAVLVEKGQRVQAGEVLAVMEAMKMELSLKAPHDGTVTDVAVEVGERVPLGSGVATVSADSADSAEVAGVGSDAPARS
ncbi:MAG: ATP-grasp domain-containing protein [Actinomycetota bacterium]|nr:ATP-grasp domain-containing protein [Actinomycetota bacterium]